jgi:hypothetical protein
LDIVLFCFHENKELNWYTFTGGSGPDGKWEACYGKMGIDIDRLGNCYLSFGSGSIDINTIDPYPGILNVPYIDDNADCNEVVIAEYNNAGQCIWLTYFGESPVCYENVSSYSLKIDNDNNLYVTGTVHSLVPFGTPQLSSYQQHCFIAKFGQNRELLWSTYFGGGSSTESSTIDYIFNIEFDNEDCMILTGFTDAATSFPTNLLPPYSTDQYIFHNTSNSGNKDAFITKINTSDQICWSTYFGGADDDIGYSIYIDENNNYYFTGITNSDESTFPVAEGSADWSDLTFNGSGTGIYLFDAPVSTEDVIVYGDAYIAMFTHDGHQDYTFYVGGSDTDLGTDIIGDENGNIYLSIITKSSTIPFPVNPPSGMFLVENLSGTGEQDGAIITFDSNSNLIWTTYFGGINDLTEGTKDFLSSLAISPPDNPEVIDYQNLLLVGYTDPIEQGSGFPLQEPSPGDYWATSTFYEGFLALFTLQPLTTIFKPEITEKYHLTIYPNPAEYLIFIKNAEYYDPVVIYNALGQTVIATNYKWNINISNLIYGIYYLQIIRDNIYYSFKFEKK